MALYAMSDLHIRGSGDPLYDSLLNLLRTRAVPGDTVVLAGDIFDLFVGKKRVFMERYQDFFAELRAASSRGVRIHYIEGNHDFNLKRVFVGMPGVMHHASEFEIDLEGRRFFFGHGDQVDRKDYGYRALRVFFRSLPIRALFALLPGSWFEWVGRKSAQASRGAKYRVPTQMPANRIEYLRNVYRSFAAERLARGCDFVVMGHCHDLDEKNFVIGSRPGQYINVGYPRVHGSFLSWSAGDERIQRERL